MMMSSIQSQPAAGLWRIRQALFCVHRFAERSEMRNETALRQGFGLNQPHGLCGMHEGEGAFAARKSSSATVKGLARRRA